MNNITAGIFVWLRRAGLVLSLCALLTGSGCGGGGLQVAGVGTGGTGLAEGTVSGFGSVIVDGIEYDDAAASIQQDDGTGASVNADLQLGQRVQLSLNADNSVQSVAVLPQLVGSASTAQDASGSFRMLGQLVRLAGSTADTSMSPTAVVAGFNGAGIAVGDSLEVHGTWVLDKPLGSYVLIASRVEKLTSVPALLQLSGVVQALTGNVLRLNATLGVAVQGLSLPPGLVIGHSVRVWATPAAWNASLFTPLQASRIIDSTLTVAQIADKTLRLSGPVASYNAASRTVELQGMTVQLSPQLQLDEVALARGAFVSLAVQRSGAGLLASSGAQRGIAGTAADLGQSAAVKAVTNGIDWTGDTVQLNLRGVFVTAAAATISPICRQAVAGMDVLVEVTGLMSNASNTVQARQITCTLMGNQSNAAAPGTIIVRAGLVNQLNLMAGTFNLHTLQGNVTVQWDMQTFFDKEFNMRPDSLTGKSVEVEGVNQTGFLRARTVRRGR